MGYVNYKYHAWVGCEQSPGAIHQPQLEKTVELDKPSNSSKFIQEYVFWAHLFLLQSWHNYVVAQ